MKTILNNIRGLFRLLQDLFKIFTPVQKKRLLKLQIVVIANAILQPLSIMAVLPFFNILLNNEKVKQSNYYHWAIENFHLTDNEFVLYVAIGTFVILLAGTTATIVTESIIFRSCSKMAIELQNTLFSYYIHKDYSFFATTNSSVLIAQIQHYVEFVINAMVSRLLRLLSSAMVCFAIIFFLFIQQPTLSLCLVIILLIVYSILIKVFKKNTEKIGAEISKRDMSVLRSLTQSFEGIKEIKIKQIEKKAEDLFHLSNDAGIKAMGKREIYSSLPKHIIIISVYFILVFFITFFYIISSSNQAIMEMLILFALTGMRLIPIVQEIYTSMSVIWSSKGAYQIVKYPLLKARINQIQKTKKENNTNVIPIENHIQLNNISFRYTNSNQYALKNLMMEIPIGSTVGLAGESGSGKTTCVDIVLMLLNPESGKIYADGVEITENTVMQFRKNFSYVPQTIFLIDDTIAQNIAFGEDTIDEKKLQLAIEQAQLASFIETLPEKYNTFIGERGVRLSGGQRQRIGIARALYSQTPIIVFDEATSALDVVTENEIVKSIERLQGHKTIVIIAHRLSTIKKCDLIFYFENGSIKDKGTYNELITKNERFKNMALMS